MRFSKTCPLRFRSMLFLLTPLFTAAILATPAASQFETRDFGRFPSVVYDEISDRFWRASLSTHIEVALHDHRRASTENEIVVDYSDGDDWVSPVVVSGSGPGACLCPAAASHRGKIFAAWVSRDPATRAWSLRCNYSVDGTTWLDEPLSLAESGEMILNPFLLSDPVAGRIWIFYERWSDHSIAALRFEDGELHGPETVSSGGEGNHRPRAIVARTDGPNDGRVFVVWDSYRDLDYDIFMRPITRDLEFEEERRVTAGGCWESQPDIIEDEGGRIWVTWVRKQFVEETEHGAQNHMCREVFVKFYDGERWNYPSKVKWNWEDGKVSEDGITMYPRLFQDRFGRIYVFYKHSPYLLKIGSLPWVAHIKYRRYVGDRWGIQNIVGRTGTKGQATWFYSMAYDGDRCLKGSAELIYLNPEPKILLEPLEVALRVGFHQTPSGRAAAADEHVAYKQRDVFEERPSITHDGELYYLYHGDTHTHSQVSDGIDPLDLNYNYARDIARLDFFAATDHDFPLIFTPGLEAYYSSMVREFETSGFMTLQGYEWSSGHWGHRVVLYDGLDRPMLPGSNVYKYCYDDPIYGTDVWELYDFLEHIVGEDGTRALLSSHNMKEFGVEFSMWDRNYEPNFDIGSLHCQSETSPKLQHGDWYYSSRQLWNARYMVGVMENTDAHLSNAIGCDLSGVWMPSLEKEHLFDAIEKRRVFGMHTAGSTFKLFDDDAEFGFPTMRLWFTVDDEWMGAAVVAADDPVVRLEVDTFEDIATIELFRDEDVLETIYSPGTSHVAVYTDTGCPPGEHYYFARVTLANGMKAWPSPVFVLRR